MRRLIILLLIAAAARAQAPPLLLALAYDTDYRPTEQLWVEIVVSDKTTAFEVLRSTTRGGPYALIGSAPQAFADTCGIGCYRDTNGLQTGARYYYVVRTPGSTALSVELAALMPGPAASPVGPPD